MSRLGQAQPRGFGRRGFAERGNRRGPKTFQLQTHLTHRGNARIGVFVQHPADQVEERFGQARADLAQIGQGLGHDGVEDAGRVVGCEGQLARQHFVEHHPQRPDVVAGLDRFSAEAFGAHVRERSQDGVVAGELRYAADVGHAKVGQASGAIRPQQDVVGLDVAMHDLEPMGARQGVGQIETQRYDALLGERAGIHEAAQRAARHIFHDQIMSVLVQNFDDIGVVEAGQGLAFALEALDGFTGGIGGVAVEQLDGHLSAVARVGGAEDLAHASPPQRLVQQVASDRLVHGAWFWSQRGAPPRLEPVLPWHRPLCADAGCPRPCSGET